MNFGTLKSRLLAIIGRAPADVCYELVTADINQEMRLAVMEKTTTLTEAASITLPADFLEVVSIYRNVDPRTTLEPLPPQSMQRMYDSTGTPAKYSIVDDSGTKKMLLTPSPSGSESLELRYYASFADLSADGDENDVLTSYPSVYVYGALAHHALLIQDMVKAEGWGLAYEKAKRQAVGDDRKNRLGGSPLIPVVRSTP